MLLQSLVCAIITLRPVGRYVSSCLFKFIDFSLVGAMIEYSGFDL